MARFNDNILPPYSSGAWSIVEGTISGETVQCTAGAQILYAKNVTDYTATGYALLSCGGCTGLFYAYIVYQDTETQKYQCVIVQIPTGGIKCLVALPEATTNKLSIAIRCFAAGTIQSVSFQLIEQAIRSVDVEYASGDSKTVPPTTGWQTTPPAWQTNKYIWQRTATTFVDGHIEYSDPVCIQALSSVGIYAIEEQYYLSTSETEQIDGYWGASQPTWVSGTYIWTRSRITWTDQSVTYTTPVLAKALNDANKHITDVDTKIDDLDEALDQDGIFNRLTNNGKAQGLFIENSNVYVNATYIKSGTLLVQTSDKKDLFRASMSARSVYIAGFTARVVDSSTTNPISALYTGSCTSLGIMKKGVYMGTDGITVSTNVRTITLANGALYGGGVSGAQTGFIHFANYWIEDKTYGCRIGGAGGIFLMTPRIGVSAYAPMDGTYTHTIGQSKTVAVPQYNSFKIHPYVYNITASSITVVTGISVSGNTINYTTDFAIQKIHFDRYDPGNELITFTKGLMTTS